MQLKPAANGDKHAPLGGKQDAWARREDARPACLAYDAARRRLVTAAAAPRAWQHKALARDRTGHREPLRGALFNAAFGAAVTADEGGTVCVWRTRDGAREGRFANAHGDARLTALAFDANGRRLATAASDAGVRVWNFNSGALLRR